MDVILKQLGNKILQVFDQNKNSPFLVKSFINNFWHLHLLLVCTIMNRSINEQKDHPKKISDSSYEPIRNVSKLSPYHQRVTIEKRYLERKQKMRSILIMGHLQKMQLNAINNRSIQNIRKTKVAEQMSKKRYQSMDSKDYHRANVQLKIDNRKKRKQKIITQIESNINSSYRSQKIQQAYEMFIQDYLQRLSQDKLLEQGMDRKKIIEEACEIIRTQMAQKIGEINKTTKVKTTQKQQNATLNQIRKLSTSQQNLQLPSIQEFTFSNKKNSLLKSDRLLEISHRRNAKSLQREKEHQTSMMRVKPSSSNKSVIEIEYNENLKKLENEQNFLSKQRMREQKLFLRKMRLIGMKNAATLRSFLKEQ